MVDTSVTTKLHPDLQFGALYEGYCYLLATTFEHSNTELQVTLTLYVKWALSYWLAALQHIPCLHSTFDGIGASLQYQPTSLILCSQLLNNSDRDTQ